MLGEQGCGDFIWSLDVRNLLAFDDDAGEDAITCQINSAGIGPGLPLSVEALLIIDRERIGKLLRIGARLPDR